MQSPIPGVKTEEWTLIQRILNDCLANLSHLTVEAFGSRTTSHFRTDSDLDLWINAPIPLQPRIISRLREQFEESTLPYSVDLIEKQRTPASIQANIEKLGRTLVFQSPS
jgi:predicted nucleotidyltransferase